MKLKRANRRSSSGTARRGERVASARRVGDEISRLDSQLLADRLAQWRALNAANPSTVWMGLAGSVSARRSGIGLSLVRVTNSRLWVESALNPDAVIAVPLWAVSEVEVLRLTSRGDREDGDLIHVLEPIRCGDSILVPTVLDTSESHRGLDLSSEHYLLADVDSPRELRETVAVAAHDARQARIQELVQPSHGVRLPTQRPRRLASVPPLRVSDPT